MKKTVIALFAMFIALGLLAAQPQTGEMGKNASTTMQASKEDRVSGTIVRSNKDKSSLVVKEHRSEIERSIVYNDSTKWTQGTKPAEMKDFKDGARVICLGKLNEKNELTATRIDLQVK